MKIIRDFSYSSKEINYLGILLIIPSWVEYLTTDDDGLVLGWENNPILDLSMHKWEYPKNGYGNSKVIAIVDLEGIDWKDTLVEIE